MFSIKELTLLFMLGWTAEANEVLTIGSAIELVHLPTSYRLFSGKISWGRGTGEQAVTALPPTEAVGETSTLWQIRESSDSESIGSGTPIKCGQVIRLQHLDSGQVLKISRNQAALSKNLEVSGVEVAEGTGNFFVECTSNENKFWTTKQPVILQDKNQKTFLLANKHTKFDQRNCPRCPIVGHLEVSGSLHDSGELNYWFARQGLLLHVDDDDTKGHEEL